MNPILAQANAILACPHLQWNEQARQLIPVIEGLVKELLDAQMDTRRLDWLEKTECGIGRPDPRFTTGENTWFWIFTRDDDHDGNTLREAIDNAATALDQPPTPATSGTHQPDSVTGDARQACSFQQPEPTTTIP
jgi:hypothetical protein